MFFYYVGFCLNYLLLWLILFLVNLGFMIFLLYFGGVSYLFFLFYFFQELLGFLFMFGVSTGFVLGIFLLKVGVGPFFLCYMVILKKMNYFIFFLFVYWSKLVYLPILDFFFLSWDYFFLGFLLGALVQFFLFNVKDLVFLSSVESVNLFLGLNFFSSEDFLLFIIFYYFLFLGLFDLKMYFFNVSDIMYFLAVPINMVFFFKLNYLFSFNLLWLGVCLFFLLLGLLSQLFFLLKIMGVYNFLINKEFKFSGFYFLVLMFTL